MNFISSLCWLCLSATVFFIGGSWASYLTASNLTDHRAPALESAYEQRHIAKFAQTKEPGSGYQKDESSRKPPCVVPSHS